MPHVAPTRFSVFAQGAVSTYARQKIAQDSKIDLRPLFDGLTAKNFKARKPVLALGLKGALTSKLAKDADLGDVEAMLDQVEEAVEQLSDTIDDVEPVAATPDPDAATDDDGDVVAFLTGKLSDEDLEKVKAMIGGAPAAMDDKLAKPGVPTPAMDSQIKAMDAQIRGLRAEVKAAETRGERRALESAAAAVAKQRGMFDAVNVVRPHVGEFAMDGLNDAADVYRTALMIKGEDVAGVDPSAFPALFRMAVKRSEPTPRTKPVAQDAASLASLETEFPNFRRLSA